MVVGALKKNNHIFVLTLVANPINERAHRVMAGEFIEINMAPVLNVNRFRLSCGAEHHQEDKESQNNLPHITPL